MSFIDLSDPNSIAKLTIVLLIVAFLLAFYVFSKVDKPIKSRKKSS